MILRSAIAVLILSCILLQLIGLARLSICVRSVRQEQEELIAANNLHADTLTVTSEIVRQVESGNREIRLGGVAYDAVEIITINGLKKIVAIKDFKETKLESIAATSNENEQKKNAMQLLTSTFAFYFEEMPNKFFFCQVVSKIRFDFLSNYFFSFKGAVTQPPECLV